MTNPPQERVEEVDADTLRHLFSIGEFEERAKAGILTTRVRVGSEHPAPSRLGASPGTVSHMLQYFERSGRIVAMAHEYVLPDGSLGASGQRDPKWLRLEGVTYKLRRSVVS
jgi:hypothetical protein